MDVSGDYYKNKLSTVIGKIEKSVQERILCAAGIM